MLAGGHGSDSLPRTEICRKSMDLHGHGHVWQIFQRRFSEVQELLDHNRTLIREINQNHESKVPDNLTRNVPLIQELNANISRIVQLYASLSVEFVQSMEQPEPQS